MEREKKGKRGEGRGGGASLDVCLRVPDSVAMQLCDAGSCAHARSNCLHGLLFHHYATTRYRNTVDWKTRHLPEKVSN